MCDSLRLYVNGDVSVSIAIGSGPDCWQAGGVDMCLHRVDKTGLGLIHTYYAVPLPCCAVALRSRYQNGTVGAPQGRGVVCVNQTRLHCVNQMGKTQSKPLATRHGRGTAWARHVMCELAFRDPPVFPSNGYW